MAIKLQKNSWLIGVHMSDKAKKKDVGFFRSIWTKIEDMDSSIEAAKVGAVVAGYLAVSYAIQMAFLIFSGETLYADYYDSEPMDEGFYYFQLIMYALITIFCTYVSYGIYKKQKFGFIPLISLWTLIEVGTKFYMVQSSGIVVSIIVTFAVINSLRGWLGVKKYK